MSGNCASEFCRCQTNMVGDSRASSWRGFYEHPRQVTVWPILSLSTFEMLEEVELIFENLGNLSVEVNLVAPA